MREEVRGFSYLDVSSREVSLHRVSFTMVPVSINTFLQEYYVALLEAQVPWFL